MSRALDSDITSERLPSRYNRAAARDIASPIGA
jgi:hypothetical protein